MEDAEMEVAKYRDSVSIRGQTQTQTGDSNIMIFADGRISGGAFNPAVAVGVSVMGRSES